VWWRELVHLPIDGLNLLHTATFAKDLPIVKYLIDEKQFDVNMRTAQGLMAYDTAKRYRYESLWEYLSKKNGKSAVSQFKATYPVPRRC